MLILALLTAAAFVAGFIDAVAGGGGLLSVPALLIAIPDARVALGTNKGQSVFGSCAALVTYWRGGKINKERALPTFIASGLGALAGVKLVLSLDPGTIRPIVLALLIAVALWFALRGRRAKATRSSAWPFALAHPLIVSVTLGFVLGGYDGFFGPGVGTFFIASYAALFGDELTRATANAKVANFASNLVSVIVYISADKVRFDLAIPMAAAQILGGVLGARFAIRGGERLVRAGVLLVTGALVLRLAYQIITG